MYNDLGLACYPKEFKEVVISPTKLCLQFNAVQSKLRMLGNSGKQLPKDPKSHQPVSNISTGDQAVFGLLSVGCQMPVLFNLVKTILVSLDKYGQEHRDTFKKTYDKDLKDEVKQLKTMIDAIYGNLK